jgi:hypothetical protein
MNELSKQAQLLLLAIDAVRGIDQTPASTVTERIATILLEFRETDVLRAAMEELWDQKLYGILDDEAPHYIEGLTYNGKIVVSELITAGSVPPVLDALGRTRFDSTTWTGRFELSISQRNQITCIMSEIRSIVEAGEFSNSHRANALALIEAAERLAETSDPQWPEIVMLLKSPVLAGVTGIAGLLLALVQILLSAIRP